MSYPNQYVGGLSPKQKARRWKQKKWYKVRHMEDLCDPRTRLIPLYSSGGNNKSLDMKIKIKWPDIKATFDTDNAELIDLPA